GAPRAQAELGEHILVLPLAPCASPAAPCAEHYS
ncbi:hypothetical protein A2U01_0099770, partial [Trifolium medium]|nr:hypothetical protein [Trifolium medium]